MNNGYVTAVAIGQRPRLYSGVRMYTWFYLSSINNISGWYKGVDLYSKPLVLYSTFINRLTPIVTSIRGQGRGPRGQRALDAEGGRTVRGRQ